MDFPYGLSNYAGNVVDPDNEEKQLGSYFGVNTPGYTVTQQDEQSVGGPGPSMDNTPNVLAPPPTGDVPEQNPLMGDLQRTSDWKGNAAAGLGAALGGLLGGSGGAQAAGAGASSLQTGMLGAIQQMRGLQAQDREHAQKLDNDMINAAHMKMDKLTGVDIANMPPHIQREIEKVTQMYNAKMADGLTPKEAREVMAAMSLLESQMQAVKGSDEFGLEQAKGAGEQARAKSAATIGVDPNDPSYRGQTSAEFSAEHRTDVMAKAKTEAANIAAAAAQKRYGNNFDQQLFRMAWSQAYSTARANNSQYGESAVDPNDPAIAASAMQIYEQMARTAPGGRAPAEGAMTAPPKGPRGMDSPKFGHVRIE